MEKVQVIVKPLGAIVLGVLAVGGVASVVFLGGASVRGRKASAKTASVGKSAVGLPTAASPAKAPYVRDAGEIGEANEITAMNTAEQSRPWLFVGPLPAGSTIQGAAENQSEQWQMDKIIGTNYLPDEAKYQGREGATLTAGGQTFTWRKVEGSAFDFKTLFATPETPMESLENKVVYGFTRFNSAKAQKKVLRFRSDDGAIVWLNGKQVHKTTKIRGLREEDKIPVQLREGKNTLLVKVGQGKMGWGMLAQLKDK